MTRRKRVKRFSFLMRIRPELKAQYQKRHDELWPDMARAITESGIKNYSIFFRGDGLLFGYFESEDPAKSLEQLGRTDVNARWQESMDGFFVKKDPSTVGPDIETIEEVFHQD
jgi:L-rhamnose mutarotase